MKISPGEAASRPPHLFLPVGEDPGGFPAGHQGGKQAQDQSRAVKQHVEAIRDQSQAVRPNTVKKLDKGERLEHINVV